MTAQPPPSSVPPEASSPSNWAAKVLGPALQLWLRSQVDEVHGLAVRISSQDLNCGNLSSRQILSGRIPSAQISADRVIYRGLHLGQLRLLAQDIRMNLGQAVRGQPLRLLSPLAVEVRLAMVEADLNASLTSPLLATVLETWLAQLLCLLRPDDGPMPLGKLHRARIGLAAGVFILHGQWQVDPAAPGHPLSLQAGFSVDQGNCLQLQQPCWCAPPPPGLRPDLQVLAQLLLPLGSDVQIEQLSLEAGQLILAGQLKVNP